MIEAIVTDIEGTTSAIAFVKDILFPYAATAIPDFVRAHRERADLAEILDGVARESGLPRENIDALVAQLLQWIREDRKITPLKTLQGLVWRAGYESGVYKAHMYADAAVALRGWHARGIPLYVYSSGSIAAQQLFFAYSEAGDLTELFSGYFDTTTGAKQDSESYRKISEAIGVPPDRILFLSDVAGELDAARAAGFHTCWLQRPEDSPAGAPAGNDAHPCVQSFADIALPGGA